MGKNVRFKQVQGENFIKTLVEQSKRADILVMTQEKKNFLEKLVMGDKVAKIAHKTDIPLLVMHRD